MAKLLKLRRGTTSQHSSFTGAEGEVTVDTTKDVVVVHDGSTAGGHAMVKESGTVATASIATNVQVTANNTTDETVYPVFVDSDQGGSQGIESDTGLTYNPSTGMLTSTGFTGALTGNAATATKIASAVNIGGVSFDGSASINLPGVNTAGSEDTSGTAALATEVTATANNSTDETVYPTFVDGTTGAQGIETDSGLTYNPSTGLLTAVGLTLSGNLTVNGTTTTVASTNTTVTDNLIELNSGAGSNANDCGILIERGSTGNNAIIAWDESVDKFTVGTTTAVNTDTGNLTITTGTLVANIEGTVTGTATGLAGSPNITVGTVGCGAITGTSTIADSKGDVRKIIQNTQGSAYTLVAADAGKHILASGTVTVPDGVFAAGDAVTIVNNTGSNLTITKTITTMYNAADGSSANRTLGNRGMATILFVSGTVSYISGSGLT